MKISAIIVAKDEEKKIKACLDSISWVDEVILIDSGSKDRTKEIAKKAGARTYQSIGGGWSKWRNLGARKARGEWLFYVDADERVTKELREEIIQLIDNKPDKSIYAIPRANIILGKKMKHGGWWPDYVKRLIKKKDFKRWEGDLHEEPVVDGEMGHLKYNLVHIKHSNLKEMVVKSNIWSELEARLLYNSNHPDMTWWRFFRIMITELFYRLVVKGAFLDGVRGVMYAIYQMWSRFIIYTKLWEMQKRNYDTSLFLKSDL